MISIYGAEEATGIRLIINNLQVVSVHKGISMLYAGAVNNPIIMLQTLNRSRILYSLATCE